MKSSSGETSGSVFILPVTKTWEIVYIKEFKYNCEDYALQIPAGGTEEDDFQVAAAKELAEETGYKADKYIHLWDYFTHGYVHGTSKLYLALGCEKIHEQNTHELEEIEVFTGSPAEVWKLIEENVIKCPWSTLSYKLAAEKTDNFTNLDI